MDLSFLIPMIIKSRKRIIVMLAILFAFFLVASFLSLHQWIQNNYTLEQKGLPDLSTVQQDQLQNSILIHYKIDSVYNQYSDKHKVINFGHNTQILQKYYLLPVFDAGGNVQYMITYEAQPKDFEAMDKILEQTWSNGPHSTELNVEYGLITGLSDENKKLLDEWLQKKGQDGITNLELLKENNILGTTDENAIKAKIAPYMIKRQTADTFSIEWLVLLFFTITGVLGILIIFLMKSKKAIKWFEPPVDRGLVQMKKAQGTEESFNPQIHIFEPLYKEQNNRSERKRKSVKTDFSTEIILHEKVEELPQYDVAQEDKHRPRLVKHPKHKK